MSVSVCVGHVTVTVCIYECVSVYMYVCPHHEIPASTYPSLHTQCCIDHWDYQSLPTYSTPHCCPSLRHAIRHLECVCICVVQRDYNVCLPDIASELQQRQMMMGGLISTPIYIHDVGKLINLFTLH